MRQWQIWAGAVLMMGLAGCESIQKMADNFPGMSSVGTVDSAPTVKRQVPFPVDTYAALSKTGTATIKGRLAYQLTSGQTVYGNREKVSIAPATEYSAEAADKALAGQRVEPADPRAQAYTHMTTTDANGYFTATGIPAGTFYVAGTVALPGGQGRSPFILKQVRVKEGGSVNVELSR
ncbi:carboxypeptidase-like regulatory domain-containing protein [Kushneria sp. Sum13]|uniref:carboxypeptidase-like regulatory domain-containing protein n=1 Tax=Kushneria sp. Sum13 TaxID=3459196 RepID=UPI004045A41C